MLMIANERGKKVVKGKKNCKEIIKSLQLYAFGAPPGARTPDNLIKSQMLYQLS